MNNDQRIYSDKKKQQQQQTILKPNWNGTRMQKKWVQRVYYFNKYK